VRIKKPEEKRGRIAFFGNPGAIRKKKKKKKKRKKKKGVGREGEGGEARWGAGGRRKALGERGREKNEDRGG